MALDTKQIADLNALNQKIAGGYTATATDTANLNYAKSKGYTYNPMPTGSTKIAGPSGLQGLNESQIYRSGVDIYKIPTQMASSELGGATDIPDPEKPSPTDINALMAGVDTGTEGTKAILEQINAPLPSQPAKDAITKRQDEVAEENKTVSEDTNKQVFEQFAGPENVANLQTLMPQIASAQARYAKMQEELSGSNGLTRIIGGTQDRLARQQAVEMAGLGAMAQAYQGNIQLAQSMANDAINAKYKDIEMYNSNLTNQLNAVYDDLNREDKARADSLNLVIAERERAIANEKEQEMNINSLMITLAESGVDSMTLNKIRNAKSYQDAIEFARPYLQNIPDGMIDLGNGNYLDVASGVTITPSQFGSSVIIPESSRIASVHNNPGNLMFANQPGATKGEPKAGGGYWAYFESPEAGFEALKRQVELDASRGLTLEKFINKYAPSSENDTNTYLSQAMEALGVGSDKKISEINTDALAQFIAKKESGTVLRTPTTSIPEDASVKHFNKTQLNKGAQRAGLGIEDFGRLPRDIGNVFVNGSKQDIQNLLSGIYFDEHAGADGYVSPDDYNKVKKEYTDAGFKADDFDKAMEVYRNPGNNNYNIGETQVDFSAFREEEKTGFWKKVGNFFKK